MTGKEYMENILKMNREVCLITEQIKHDMSLVSGVRSLQYNSTRVQTSKAPDRIADIVSRIDQEKESLYNKIMDLQKKKDEARELLLNLKEEHERVLVYYYFEGLTIDNIAHKMNFSNTHIYELRKSALNELSAVLNAA